jgi:hypothetical protein
MLKPSQLSLLITLLLCVFLTINLLGKPVPRAKGQEADDELGVHLTPEHKKKVIKELTAMGYSQFMVFDYYHLNKCPHGHLDFTIHFSGTQFKQHKRSGYFCPPYVNQSVVYSGEKL